jgi:LysM repeat protein
MADGLEELENSLSEEIGGVPVWVVGAGIGLAVGVGIWLYRRNQNNGIAVNTFVPDESGSEAGDSDPTNSDIGLPNGPVGDWLSENPGSTAFPVGGSALPTPITNGQWARQVIDGLIGKGDDPTLVNNAITKYVGGQALSTAEKSIVNLALQLYGSLPEGAKAILDGSTAPVATGARGYGWYKVVKGDTPAKIAAKYKISIATFYAFNGMRALVPGQYVKVRANSNPLVGYTGK